MMEFLLRFKSFKSCKKVTVLFQWSCFIKLSYDAQISWNNIFCQFPLNFFDYNSILISILIAIRRFHTAHINLHGQSYFPTMQINGFTCIMSKFSIIQLYRTFSEIPTRVIMLVMTAYGNFTFNWIFYVYSFI